MQHLEVSGAVRYIYIYISIYIYICRSAAKGSASKGSYDAKVSPKPASVSQNIAISPFCLHNLQFYQQ